MKIKTNVKAGRIVINHNQTVAHSLKVKITQWLSPKRAWAKMMLTLMAVALVALTVTRMSTILTRAQIDPSDGYEILQNGIRVGEIYVPERDPKAIQYVEHWVLYNSYVYPNKDMPDLKTEIRVAQKSSYKSEADFFARVPMVAGYRYVRVECTEFDRLPGR